MTVRYTVRSPHDSMENGRAALDPKSSDARESSIDSTGPTPRIAHTLTACCRCRQRKTRCDPNLPRCTPCERAGAICEYFDAQKGKRISRTYVVRLQDRVRALEAELGQYVDDDEPESDSESLVRPGTLVRLSENDETPRYLGPSSGIAMTRIVMEEAKKYTESRTIRELVPEVRSRKTPIYSPESATLRRKSYPVISAVAAPTLPSRLVMDKLVEVYLQKAQYFQPVLHEPSFFKDLDDVYQGDSDPYRNFIVRMISAISMQKLDIQYAGLADSYYLAAMAYIEAVIRPKDLRTLQCLVLIAQYSLITPTRTAIYYIVGLATRLCQQLGIANEKTISSGVSAGLVNPIQLDLRRRLVWIVISMEFGLAQAMGRPNGFASGDYIDIKMPDCIDDEYITAEGVFPGPVSEKKQVANHMFRMKVIQAEIRRTLYQKKRVEPIDDQDTWFQDMEKKMDVWREAFPKSPVWAAPWFTNRYNTIIIFMYRPSPQIPKPSVQAAIRCYEASVKNIASSAKQVEVAFLDITWITVLALFQAMNTLLWTISYAEVRALHGKDEVQKSMDAALDTAEKCRERWPGTEQASNLYVTLTKACLRSYGTPEGQPSSLTPPPAYSDATSPTASDYSSMSPNPQAASHPPIQRPRFKNVFGMIKPEPIRTNFEADVEGDPFTPAQAGFRNSALLGDPTLPQSDRRFSYFPPDFTQPNMLPDAWSSESGTEYTKSPLPPASLRLPPSIKQEPPSSTSAYFSDATTYMFPDHYFPDSYNAGLRQGSLSQQQQTELMRTLETDGISHIESFMNNPAESYKEYLTFPG